MSARRSRQLTPEGAVLRQVKDGLRARRVPFWRVGVGAFRAPAANGRERFVQLGDAGMADLVALVPGVGALFVEVKSARGRLTPEQVAFRDACRAAGAVHVVCRGWDDLEPWLTPRLRSGT